MNLIRISIGQGGNQLNYSLSNLIAEKKEDEIIKNVICPFSTDTCKSVIIDSEAKV